MNGEKIIKLLYQKYRLMCISAILSIPIYNFLMYMIICFQVQILAQQDQFKFEHITIQQGLTDNQIYSIGQDKLGFMWFGTPSGLNRFDGYNVKVYSHMAHYARSPIFEDDNGSLWMLCWGGEIYRFNLLTEKFISYPSVGLWTYQLFKDQRGEIWAGTIGGGISKYIHAADSFITYKNKIDDCTSISSDTVYVMFEDSEKNFWIGTANGLNLFDPNKRNFKHWINKPRRRILTIAEDKNGIIWLGTWGDGVYEVDKSLKILKHYIEPSVVYFICVDSRNNLWVETNLGISYFNRASRKFINYKNYSKYHTGSGTVSQTSILENNNGTIWSIVQRNIIRFEPNLNDFVFLQKNPLSVHSISDNLVNEIFKDNTGNLWLGTNSGGVNYLSSERKPFFYFPKKFVTSIFKDKTDVLWIGTQNGIFKIRNDNESIYKKIEGYDGIVCQITEDTLGNLWIAAGENGLYSLDIRSQKIMKRFASGEIISRVFIDKKGIIWIGSWDNLFKYNPSKNIFSGFNMTPKGEPPHVISFIYEDHSSNLWVGGYNMLTNIDKNIQKNVFNNIDKKNLFNHTFNTIYEDSNNKIWIGSSHGLYNLNSFTNKLNKRKIEDELDDEGMYGIGGDNKGALWILTSDGVLKYDTLKGDVKIYSAEDGAIVPSTSFPYLPFYNGKNGEIYFGGIDGYVMFYPDSVKDNTYIPTVVITSFKIFNKEVKLDTTISMKKTIYLTYSENNISFEFAALNYTSPQKNQYAYKLDGFEKDWTYCGTRRNASYTNLDHGSYAFRVKGSNNDGVWNEKGTSVFIIITPPWWKTGFAYLLYALIICSVIYFIWRMQLKRIKVKHEYQMSKFEAEKLHEVDELKSRFFTNISHEFRTPLTLILGPVKQIIERTKEERTKNDLNVVHKNANNLLGLVNQLLDISKLESGNMKLQVGPYNIIPLLKALLQSFCSYAERKRINLKFNSTVDEITVYVDKEKIEKIITNILSNSFKFTPEGGEIEVAVKSNSHSLQAEGVFRSKTNKSKSVKNVLSPLEGRGVGKDKLTINDFAEITIRDTGIGIPKEKIPKIFDRFYQVDGSNAREQVGTGIGLSLTKELVELHKGSIEVESEEGRGTIFTIRFPLGKEHLNQEEICEAGKDEVQYISQNSNDIDGDETDLPRSMLGKPAYDLISDVRSDKERKPILLIVEDNADVRNYIKNNLEKDYKIFEAIDGEDGWNKSIKIIPDLIISDVMMPKMDGFKLCEKLKTDERTSHIPVILLTAKASSKDKIEGLETGADEYLMKPFEPDELKVRIKNLIEQRKRLHEYFRKHGVIELEESKITSIDKKFLEKIFNVITKNISNSSFNVKTLSEELSISYSVLHKKIASLTGELPVELIRRVRLNKAAELIEKGFGNINEIALETGFNNPAYFSECFKKQFGVPPSQYIAAN